MQVEEDMIFTKSLEEARTNTVRAIEVTKNCLKTQAEYLDYLYQKLGRIDDLLDLQEGKNG